MAGATSTSDRAFQGSGNSKPGGAVEQLTDWSKTTLRSVAEWPPALQTAVRVMCASSQPMFIWWGENLLHVHNPAFQALIGAQAIAALGQPADRLNLQDFAALADKVHAVRLQSAGTTASLIRLSTEPRGLGRPPRDFYLNAISDHTGAPGGVLGVYTGAWRQAAPDPQNGLTRFESGDVADNAVDAQALRDSEERFSKFMQHLPGLAWIKDAEGRYVFVNDAAAQAFQRQQSELYGRTDDELFLEPTARQFQTNDALARSGGGPVETIETLEQEDGVHHSLVSKFPIPDSEGNPSMIGGIAIDVTERIEAERALRDSEERFRTIAMNAPAAIFIKNLEGRYTLCNPLASQALGHPEGATGFTDHELLPASAADKIVQRDLEVIRSGRSSEQEEHVPLGGQDRYFLSVKFPLQDSAGMTIGVCGVAVDITDRKQVQQALRESERRLLLATQTGKVGVWAWDIVAHRISWSESL